MSRALLHEGETLEGGDVLPGLRLPVERIFVKVPPMPAKRKRRRRK